MTSFLVVFIGEFGDLTQIVIVNLAARYHDPLAVGTGSLIALWAVGGLAIVGGRGLLRVVPIRLITLARGCRHGRAGRDQPDQRDSRLTGAGSAVEPVPAPVRTEPVTRARGGEAGRGGSLRDLHAAHRVDGVACRSPAWSLVRYSQ